VGLKSVYILNPDERVIVEQYRDILRSGKSHVLVDVRPKDQSNVSRLANALQLPVMFMLQNKEETI
jgi:hypothetical protein